MKQKRRVTVVILTLFVLAVSLFSAFGCAPAEPPALKLKQLTWAVSTPLPRAEDFVEALPTGCTVRFAEEYRFTEYGEHDVELVLTDARGKSFSYFTTLSLIKDTVPPTLVGLRDLVAYLGGGVSYLSGVTAEDNCDGAVSISVDTSDVDLKSVGVYDVIYTATDAAGNVATFRRTLAVYEQEITEQMLNELIDPILGRIITDGMTVKQQLRAIYDYVYDNVAYVSTSDKSSWVRAAYDGLQKRQGDCYTYFALSKAMMERLGIENLDVERAPSVVALVQERHYWSMVNIGSDADPVWYHFDACHLQDMPKPWGYLMTDEQLAYYSEMRESENGIAGYFYAFDAASYPKSATTIVTPVFG